MGVILLSPPGSSHEMALRAAIAAALGSVLVEPDLTAVRLALRGQPRALLVLDLRAAPEGLAAEIPRLRLEHPALPMLALVSAGSTPPRSCDAVFTEPIFLSDIVRWCGRTLTAPVSQAALADLATGLRHEIGNPLTTVLLQLQMLQEDERNETMKSELALLAESGRRIQSVLQDVSGATERKPVHPAPTRLSAVVSEARRLLAAKRDDLAERLDLSCEDVDVHVDVPVVAGALCDLWQYLLLAGEQVDVLRIEARARDARNVVITCRAHAPKLPDDAASRLFTPLWARQALGLANGLSLSSARAAFLRHRGDLRAWEQPAGALRVEALLPRDDLSPDT